MGLLDPKWKLSSTDAMSYDWSTANQDWEYLRMATYAAMVDRMDQNIGKVFAICSITTQLPSQLAVHRGAADAEDAGGFLDVAVRVADGAADQRSFDVAQR